MFFSHASNNIESTYLGLAQLEKCDTSSFITVLQKILVTMNVDINNCITIGTDNASVMVGINKGVYYNLKQDNPSLILMRFVRHSMQLAMYSASAECLPRNLVYLIAKTHNWLQNHQ